ncbi:6,7-dimethyl-8-ribityllumazine synthase [Thiosulfatimonas sediminis]|uniref:6,7-dimethyl-8-ribityllumazine synthase n=1 Tax=Thiosulfatimonas sediminis TaxID=2675054 RepID=A0A6F8PU85_9GAMM|nr:6,7-dimethyl-8-ribityllumazine synthase [Thiosulfatimonas sediminis]BBP45703.1 6,7-dimethyl-8-ribityllumazine synthase [Thiosulfatimonas sediminis]
MKMIEGNLSAQDMKIGFVVTRWNSFIVDHLVKGSVETIERHGGSAENITQVMVPGAFEVPLAVEKMAASGKYDAIVALGAVIQGGTPHFDFVAGEAVKGISQVMLKHGVPVAFGILTVNSIEQAIERSGTKMGNKGEEATLAAIEMVNVLKQI